MAISSNELYTSHHIRSFSFPSKSNPINKRIEEELEKLRIKEESSKSSAETVSIGLSGLADLYLCINQVLSSPMTQQALSLRQHEKCVVELLKVCSNLQNVCSATKDIVLQQNKLTQDLLSALSSPNNERKLASYTSSRKGLIKTAKGLLQSLKPLVDDDSFFGSSGLLENEDHRLSPVIKALTCVSIISASVYESLLFFLSSPVSKPTLGSLVSKFIHKSRAKSPCHTKSGNELTDVDIAFQSLNSKINGERVQYAQQRMEDLVDVMQGIKIGLDNAHKQLTETKGYLKNIVSF